MKRFFSGTIIRIAVIALALLPVFSVSTLAEPVAAQTAALAEAPHSLIVQFKEGAPAILSDTNILSSSPLFPGTSDAQFKNVDRLNTYYTAQGLAAKYSADIVYAENEQVMQAGSVTVNDPGFSTDAYNTDREWGLLRANFENAWDTTTGSAKITVALVDTGIDGTHEDLSNGQVGPGFNFTNNTFIPLGSNSDDNGHGTLVAGVIAATPNNFRGITGTDWSVTLMPLKALDASGSGNSGNVAAAIVWAADHGASVINMSLGGLGFQNDTTLSNAISYAFSKNVVLVAAAGNDVAVTGGNMDVAPVFPVCADNGKNMVIGVSATDVHDLKANFSNYGKACVDVSAPGVHILSTTNRDGITKLPVPNAYAYASGTSLAAPFVSGEAALIKAAYPNASNIEIRDRIIKSADQIDGLNVSQCDGGSCAGLIGSGRINAAAALDKNLIPSVSDGSIVEAQGTTNPYYISGGQKQPLSAFVESQRFPNIVPTQVPQYILDTIPTGPDALPLDGTLVRSSSSATVYQIASGFKDPVQYPVFVQRNLASQPIFVAGDQDVNSWITGNFLPPVEGTLVRGVRNPTVYWVVGGLLHPINYNFWKQKGLNIFPIMSMPDNDIGGYATGPAYIR